jgi:hypothetical protein
LFDARRLPVSGCGRDYIIAVPMYNLLFRLQKASAFSEAARPRSGTPNAAAFGGVEGA